MTNLSEICNLFDNGLEERTVLERSISSALQNAQPSCSVRDFDPSFLDVLYSVWRKYPFVISSGYRSVEYEKSRGRSGKSSHTKGLAADIVCTTNAERYLLIFAFLATGVCRVGVAKNFIHVDMDYSKSQNRIWTYDDHNHERKG